MGADGGGGGGGGGASVPADETPNYAQKKKNLSWLAFFENLHVHPWTKNR